MSAFVVFWNYISFAVLSTTIISSNGFNAKYMPAVYWDPRNPLFNCPSRNVNTILVKMGDFMSFMCPVSNSNLGMQSSKLNYVELYETAYFVYPENKQDALKCNVTGYRSFLKCDRANQIFGQTIRIAPASGDSNAPLFDYGKTYYVIGTGNGLKSGMSNQVGGRCNTVSNNPERTHKMIMKIRVCTKEEETVYKNCTVCETVGCYNKGCGLYGEWSTWEYYQNVSHLAIGGALVANLELNTQPGLTTCLRRRQRLCNNEITGCDGLREESEMVPCPSKDCTAWVKTGKYFKNDAATNKIKCYVKKQRNCTVGGKDMTIVTETKMEGEDICNQGMPKTSFQASPRKGDIILSTTHLIFGIIGVIIIGFAIGFSVGCCLRSKQKKYWTKHNGALLSGKSSSQC